MTEENHNPDEINEDDIAAMTPEEREVYEQNQQAAREEAEFRKRLEELRKRDPFIYR